MSKAAQEMQRLADELKRSSRPAAGKQRRQPMAEQDQLGIEPEEGAPAAAPAEQQPTTQGAAEPAAAAPPEQPTAEGATDMAKKAPRVRGKSTKPAAAKPKAAAAKAAKPKAPVRVADGVSRPAKERDPLAGIRSKPKLQGVLLGAAVSRAVVLKALNALDPAKLDQNEQRERTRLIARIEARG